MANIKDLIKSIEAADSSFDEKLAAINQMEETLVAMRQQEEQAVQENVDLIVEAIKVMERKVENQLEIAKSIVPEKGDKGDKGERGLDGANGQDGKDGRDGINGRDGQDGEDGVSVTDAKIDFDGSLVITLSTGQEINVGEVVAPELQEKIKLVTSGGAGTVLPSQTGNANKYLKTDGTGLSWAAVSGGSGTVTSVGGTGTVNGISLSGTVTTSGNLTLGGTLDLSSPPAIGGTTPAAGTFTTLIGGGSSANYGQLTGGATTKAVEFQTLGSDANIALVLDTKGTGAIDLAAGSSGVNISNGGTVTALTRTANGTGYTGTVTWTASAPTTAGGATASGTVTVTPTGTPTVTNGGTGYTVNDVLTIVGGTSVSGAATLTVTAVSSGVITAVTITNFAQYTAVPTNPVSVTGGTGASATFTLTFGISNAFTITNAGSGYVEQPTVTFSSGTAAAYASIGAEPTIRSLFGGVTTTGLAIATAGGNQVRFVDVGDGTRPIQLFGGSAGGAAIGGINQPISAAIMSYSTNAAAHNFYTTGRGSGLQFAITTTASAVNYVQATGAATGGNPTISAQGSDGNIGLSFLTKGGFGMQFNNSSGGTIIQYTQSGTTSATTNYLRFTNFNGSGTSPILSAQGGDADIDITLTPKGAGAVRFGTYTGTILTPTGYITIKDSGGTTRRLLVG
jgi:hypothetical protein